MRSLLKKIEHHHNLTEEEYRQLLEYIENLRRISPEAYLIFYDQYSTTLAQDYNTYIPRFSCGWEDFIDYLLTNPKQLDILSHTFLPVTAFPPELQPYLNYTFGPQVPSEAVQPLLQLEPQILNLLPAPRPGRAVLKYESANPYKEPGLKTHFERLARYSFVTRLQSYRYLTRNKSSQEKIEYIAPDRLGGIFTNKQKSIYYYIFLTEVDEIKAQNACKVLNLTLFKNRSSHERNHS